MLHYCCKNLSWLHMCYRMRAATHITQILLLPMNSVYLNLENTSSHSYLSQQGVQCKKKHQVLQRLSNPVSREVCLVMAVVTVCDCNNGVLLPMNPVYLKLENTSSNYYSQLLQQGVQCNKKYEVPKRSSYLYLFLVKYA